ncbi:MAG: hypothetical protein OCD76_21225 [Reichenbachiella sp.]
MELCDNIEASGTTPSHGSIKKSRAILDIELFVFVVL